MQSDKEQWFGVVKRTRQTPNGMSEDTLAY